MEDQTKGILNLPTDPSWLKTRRPTASASQHISRKSCVCEGQAGTPAGSNCHSTGKNKYDTSTDEATPDGMQRQKKAPPVTDGALVDAAGIEPASREKQWETPQRLTKTDDPVAAYLQPSDSTGSHSRSSGALELAEVTSVWPNLPAPLKTGILAIVRAWRNG